MADIVACFYILGEKSVGEVSHGDRAPRVSASLSGPLRVVGAQISALNLKRKRSPLTRTVMINTRSIHPVKCNKLVRIGRDNDGGYVVPPEIFSHANALLSYGVNTDWSFERDFVRYNPKATVHCYDPHLNFFLLLTYTLKSLLAIPIYCITLDRKRLSRSVKGIGIIPDYFSFFAAKAKLFRKKVWHTEGRNSVTVPKTIAKICKAEKDSIFIKMDIEGAEYKVFDDLIKSSANIVGVVAEFHELDEYSQQFDRIIKGMSRHFRVVHVHANNYSRLMEDQDFPSVLEVTFFHKKFLGNKIEYSTESYPIPGLDQPNRFSRPDPPLRFQIQNPEG